MLANYLIQFPTSKIKERVNVFLSFRRHFDDASPKILKKQEMLHWFAKMKEESNIGDRTLRNIKSSINHFMKWLKDSGFIDANPLDEIKFSKREPPRKARVLLSRAEISKILEEAKAFSPRLLFGYLMCLVHTGCRKGEINNLKWDDVDFANNFLEIKNTKNGVNRHIKISGALLEYLSSCPRTSLYVCPNPEGKKLGRKHFDNELKRFKASSSVRKNWFAHDLRHSFAYNFLKQGGELYQLQAILGHKNIGMTVDLYGHLRASDIDDPSPYD